MADVTVGVVGLGSIGRAVAELASGFGCRVVATRRRMARLRSRPCDDGQPLPSVDEVRSRILPPDACRSCSPTATSSSSPCR